jgi:hypothetical protein
MEIFYFEELSSSLTIFLHPPLQEETLVTIFSADRALEAGGIVPPARLAPFCLSWAFFWDHQCGIKYVR